MTRFIRTSVDKTPWAHPFLTSRRIARFRDYSDRVHHAAMAHCRRDPRRLDAAFVVNMAQNMYKWATLAAKYGAGATLYLHPQDKTAISRPEWEEYGGEYANVLDGDGFLRQAQSQPLRVPVLEPPNEGGELTEAYDFLGESEPWQWQFKRLLSAAAPRLARHLGYGKLVELHARSPVVRHRPLLELQGLYPYFRWAEMLSRHEVIYAASVPIPAYASGRPYCAFSVGGDLQFDAGRNDDYGTAIRLAFASARFILVSNPHTLGHCRRLGFTNAVYLPYPMDTERYTPAFGGARREWTARFGGKVFVLTASRVDSAVKGHSDTLLDALADVARARPDARFLFLGWGAQAEALRARMAARELTRQFIVLTPVGKQRLLDYYRSSDIVLDTFVYGYFGATALEAAAAAKPVIMKLHAEQYAPLYRGDVAPVVNAATPAEVRTYLLQLIDDEHRRCATGQAMRDWIVRTHGEQVTMPLLLALLQLAADRKYPEGWPGNPLVEPLDHDEREYHEQCQQ